MRRFPDIISMLPKPEYQLSAPLAAYSFQAAAAPPVPQAWSAHTSTLMSAPLAPQAWNTHAPASPAQAPPPTAASSAATFFRTRPSTCNFCLQPGHLVRECNIAKEYVKTGCTLVIDNHIYLPNQQPIAYDSSRGGLKASIDAWWAEQSVPAPAQNRVVFARDVTSLG
jgi:hypothetical protein